MKDEFANRHNMHLTVLSFLDRPENEPIWKDQAPTAFTAHAEQLREKIHALGTVIGRQEAAIVGHAVQKAREEAELETLAHEIGRTFAAWLEAQGREGEAAEIDLSLTRWQKLRDPALLEKTRLLHARLAAAVTTSAASLADYDLTQADAATLLKEIEDYAAVIADPSAAISSRRALTRALRPGFREVSAILQAMDRLVLRFRRTPHGALFANGWTAARVIRDLGGSKPHPAPPIAPAA